MIVDKKVTIIIIIIVIIRTFIKKNWETCTVSRILNERPGSFHKTDWAMAVLQKTDWEILQFQENRPETWYFQQQKIIVN